MTTRRQFLKKTGILTAAAVTPLQDIFAEMGMKNQIGIQLFSLPKMLSENFVGGIKMLSQMGYKELELYGPFPFSTESAQKRWSAVTPQLGFSGSGYFGKSIQEVKTILADNGLKTPAMHTDLDTLQNGMDKLGEAAHILGQTYVTLPAIPDEKRQTIDDYKRIAEAFNKIGENAKRNGINFGYHNHGYGIKPMNGQIPLQIILDNTDPNLVFFELDIFWTASGGANPIDFLTKYPNRYKMLHLKDMKEKKEFSGDGGNASQWIPLFSNMTTAGDGVLDLKGIVKKAKEIGVEHYFVEQDMVASPEIALKRSLEYLKTKI
ncbi:sugar phosphate isomerase/epimerase family protein [Emticicia sp. SJ17W-69]|uniref:sugar phosphate isomerase/epimerase family protein n=1 Tax=Emticicia sp. SJ17W-69 TaxID=3421657 RepID=UPI003EB6BB43